MNRLVFFCLAVIASVALSSPAEAQVRWGVRAGLTDGEPMIGGEALIPLPGNFVANPNLEVTSELLSVNGDFHYDFNIDRRSSFWLGAGVAALIPDEGDSDLGLSVLAGYGRQHKRVYPYAQVRITSGGDLDDFASVAIGIRF